MKKQVEYAFRLLRVSATDPTASREMFESEVNKYLAAGFELFRAEHVTFDANVEYVAFHFIRYEDETPSKK